MQINPIGIGGYTDPAAAGYAVDSTNEKNTTSTIETLLEKFQSPSSETETLREIASDYDVTSMRPQELSEMLGRLHESGVLSDEEYQMLGRLRAELENAGYESDQPVNMIEFCQEKLREMSENQGESEKVYEKTYENTKQQLAWFQKMSIIQEDPEAIGLNALV